MINVPLLKDNPGTNLGAAHLDGDMLAAFAFKMIIKPSIDTDPDVAEWIENGGKKFECGIDDEVTLHLIITGTTVYWRIPAGHLAKMLIEYWKGGEAIKEMWNEVDKKYGRGKGLLDYYLGKCTEPPMDDYRLSVFYR